MWGGAGSAAVAAIDAAESQTTSAVSQAVQSVQQWNMAQNFELGITEALQGAQTGAAACQQADLACRKANVQQASLSPQFVPEARMLPPDHSIDLGKQIVDYVDQFSQREKSITSEIDSNLSKIEEVSISSATGVPASTPSIDMASALRFMQHTFEFALETSLISTASSESAKIFNQLMKEQ